MLIQNVIPVCNYSDAHSITLSDSYLNSPKLALKKLKKNESLEHYTKFTRVISISDLSMDYFPFQSEPVWLHVEGWTQGAGRVLVA